MIEIRHLRYFLAVAADRNFTRAADRLHIAQPPLSRQIQLLEDELGITLFDRSNRPLTLTPAGKLLQVEALQVVQRMDELKLTMKQFVGADRPRFVIGFVPSIIYARLPTVIRGFREAAPDVDLSLVEMSSLEQIEALNSGRIDAGFGRIRHDDPSVIRKVLSEEPLVVALPVGHALLEENRPVRLIDLAGRPLIIYPREPRPSYADQVLSLFTDQGLEPGFVQEVRELQTAIGMVAAEAGLCIVPASVQRLERSDVSYLDLAEPATSPIIMSHRRGDTSPILRILIAVLEEMYETLRFPLPSGLLTTDSPAPSRKKVTKPDA